MRRLARRYAGEQVIARAMHQLRNQRYFDRDTARLRFNPCGRESAYDAGAGLHGILGWLDELFYAAVILIPQIAKHRLHRRTALPVQRRGGSIKSLAKAGYALL